MSETVITVQGRFSHHRAPERARVTLTVSFDGHDRVFVFHAAAAAAESLASRIARDFDPVAGPMHAHSSDSVRTWAERPWNQEGIYLPLVHHANVSFTANYGDFGALARFVDDVVDIEGVTIGGVDWSLTEGTLSSLVAEVRSRAVKDAVAKASVYAQSIGLGSVRAVAIADAGMLSDTSSPPEVPHLMRFTSSTSGGEIWLRPEEIAVEAVVDARFVAS